MVDEIQEWKDTDSCLVSDVFNTQIRAHLDKKLRMKYEFQITIEVKKNIKNTILVFKTIFS